MRVHRFVGLCLEEAIRGLWFYRRVVAPSVLVMVVSLTVLGAFLLVSENLNAVLLSWRERGQLQVFLVDAEDSTAGGAGSPAADGTAPGGAGADDDSTGAGADGDPTGTGAGSAAELRARIERELHDSAAVEEFRYVGPDDAAALFRSDFAELGEVLDLLEENPLPASFAVTIRPEMRSERVLGALARDLATLPGVDGVQYDLQVIRRLELGVRSIRFGGLLLGGAVLLAAVITTANVVRVLVVSRGREIDTMRLVGASEAIVLGRFLAEGALQGVLAGFTAVAVLFVTYSLGVAYLDRGTLGFLAGLPLSFLRPAIVGSLLLGGALSGLLGSWLAFGPGGLKSGR